MRLIQEGDTSGAADALSPSELFLLGEAYLNSSQTHSDSERTHSPSPRLETHVQVGQAFSDHPESGPSAQGANGISHESPASSDDPSKEDCPVQRRLRQIIPPSDSPEVAGFRQEVQQYGALLRKRLGLNQLSLSIEDSYEQLEISAREEVLFERLCDLKIRLAEIDHALGLPASLGEVIGELAIRDILPRSTAIRTNSWKLVLEQIGRLETDNARNWIDELINRGILTLYAKGTAEK